VPVCVKIRIVSHTASLAGVSRLYHYRRFDRDHLRDVLVNQRVHCSNPSNLNGPWDCRPWFREDALDDPVALEGYVEFVNSLQPPDRAMSKAELGRELRIVQENPQHRREILERTARETFVAIPRKWRIYCLTPCCDSILMWSHYAENHLGICLEFSTDNKLFGSAEEVRIVPDNSHGKRWCSAAHRFPPQYSQRRGNVL